MIDQTKPPLHVLVRDYALEDRGDSWISHELSLNGDDILVHHGVKGMKWGVRKDDKSGGGVRSKDGEAGVVDPISVGIAVAYFGIPAAIATRYQMDKGRKYQRRSKDVAWKEKKSLTGPKTIEQLHDQVVKPINAKPPYGAKGTKMNCRRCTFAYEMRRRGYDVRATPSVMAAGQNERGMAKTIQNYKDGSKPESIWGKKKLADPRTFYALNAQDKADVVFNGLAKEPNGSRGELGVGWSLGGGHSMSYEIVNKKPIILDNQSGEIYRDAKAFTKFTPIMNDAAHTRLDNVQFDEGYIRRWVINDD